MVYKGNIQFSSPQFAKKFKQALMGPKIDKKDSYDAFDVLKKFISKKTSKKKKGGRRKTRRKRRRKRKKRTRRRKRKKR